MLLQQPGVVVIITEMRTITHYTDGNLHFFFLHLTGVNGLLEI